MFNNLFYDYIALVGWSVFGAILGFFAFAVDIHRQSPVVRIKRCLLSIILGVFLAVALFTYLIEVKQYPYKTSVVLSGLCSLGLPDFLLTNYSRLIKNFAFRYARNKADRMGDDN